MADYQYNVALSFAGEDRAYVAQVARMLQASGVSVFYDDFEQVDLWGKDLVEYFDQVYRKKAKYCVLFISSAYARKAWGNHERRSALARALEERSEYILPTRFDDTEIPGIRPTTGYIDLRELSPEDFCVLIMRKLGKVADVSGTRKKSTFRIPKTRGTDFNPYAAALTFMNQVVNEITSRCNSIAQTGVSVTSFGQDRERSLRIVTQGKTAYSFDMRIDETFGDGVITFHGTRGTFMSAGRGFNAWGNMQEDSSSHLPVLRFDDMSLFETFGNQTILTTQQFIDALWNKMCDAIEHQSGRT